MKNINCHLSSLIASYDNFQFMKKRVFVCWFIYYSFARNGFHPFLNIQFILWIFYSSPANRVRCRDNSEMVAWNFIVVFFPSQIRSPPSFIMPFVIVNRLRALNVMKITQLKSAGISMGAQNNTVNHDWNNLSQWKDENNRNFMITHNHSSQFIEKSLSSIIIPSDSVNWILIHSHTTEPALSNPSRTTSRRSTIATLKSINCLEISSLPLQLLFLHSRNSLFHLA